MKKNYRMEIIKLCSLFQPFDGALHLLLLLSGHFPIFIAHTLARLDTGTDDPKLDKNVLSN